MLSSMLPLLAGLLADVVLAQQFVGATVNNSLPAVVGAELTYWNILDANNKNATLINYSSLGSNGQRLTPSNVKRALVFMHGDNRDPWDYMSYMQTAFNAIQGHPEITADNVQMVAPYFANGADKSFGYPWNASAPAGGYGSTSLCLVWNGAGWMNGSNSQYPRGKNVPSYAVLDQMLQYFDNKALFPNLEQIVLGGHSAGAQTVQRYIAVANKLNLNTPVSYWIANPDSYLWFTTDRPLDTSDCPTYDWWRAGLSQYNNTYGASLVASGRQAVYSNYNSHNIHYARGTSDDGDDSSTCGAFTQGANRNERFANFIESFPPVACTSGSACNTVDYVPIGHDAGGMMSSTAGQARLFIDNFNGTGTQAYDFGCPRLYTGDNPFPDPSCTAMAVPEDNGTYADGFQYAGCYSDTEYPSTTLPYTAYRGWQNATIDTCVSACSAQGYSLAGAELGDSCYCGNTMFWQTYGPLTEASCSVNCTGDSTQICGDLDRISIFSLNGATPVKNPEPSSPATVGSFSYEGCYEEVPGRVLTGPTSFQNSMTIETCVNFCNNQGYSIAGLEYYTQCYCGHQLSVGANQTSDGLCNFPCGGNQAEFCGGNGYLNVYAINSTFGQPWTASTTSTTSSAAATMPTVTASTTTSAAVTTTYPAATGALSCPGSDQQTFTTNGETFVVECFEDRSGGDIGGSVPFDTTLEGCIQSCATTPGCLDVSWVPGSAAGTAYPCYMKTQINTPNSNTGVWGARYLGSSDSTFVYSLSSSVATSTTTSSSSSSVATSTITSSSSSSIMTTSTTSLLATSTVQTTTSSSSTSSVVVSSSTSSTTSSPSPTPTSLQCPAANATTFTSGKDTFVIECGNDRQGASVGLQYVDSLNDCISWCANTTSCVDVSWLPGLNAPCYLKSSIAASQSNPNVWGARLVAVNGVPLPTSTSTTIAVPSSTSSSSIGFSSTSSSSSSKTSSTSSSSSQAATSATASSVAKAPQPSKSNPAALPSSSSTSSKLSTTTSTTSTSSSSMHVSSSSSSAKAKSTTSSSILATPTTTSSSVKAGKSKSAASTSSSSTSSVVKTSTSSTLSTATTSTGKAGKASSTKTSSTTSSATPTSTSSSKAGKAGKATPTTSHSTTSSTTSTTSSSAAKATKTKKGQVSIASTVSLATAAPTCVKDACMIGFKNNAKKASKVCSQVAASPTAIIREVDVLATACVTVGAAGEQKQWQSAVSSVCGCLATPSA